MEKILRIFTRESGSINQAALLLGLFTFLSQILALFRDRAIAHFIGPSQFLDAYYVSFRIPDLIFISVASLASITVVVPFLVAKMDGDKVTKESQKYLNDIFSVFFGLMILVAFLAFVFMPKLVSFIAPGFPVGAKNEVILLSRIMLLSPLFMGLSNLFGTITQLFHKFFIYSLSPVLYNVGIIIGVLFLYPIWGIYGLSFGVVLGAFFHFFIQLISSRACGFSPRFSFHPNWNDVKKVAINSFPRTLGLAFNNLSLIIIISLASYLEAGSISIFNFSYNLQSVPLNIIGISYAVAAFPALAKSFNAGKKDEFIKHLTKSSRAIVFWSLPVVFLFIVLRAQIVRVILGSPSFSWDDTRLVAACLAIFSLSVLAQGIITLLSRAYYAMGNTKRPLFVNLICSISIVIFSFVFTYLFNNFLIFRFFIESLLKVDGISGTEVLMLPLAYSIGTILNLIIHLILIKKDLLKNKLFISQTFFQSLGASFFLGLVTYLSLNAFSPVFGTTTFWGIFLQGFISGIFGIATAFVVLFLLKNEEFKGLVETLKTKFWKAQIIVPSQEEL